MQNIHINDLLMEVCLMQKLLSFSLVLLFLLLLAACSSEEAPPSEEAEAKEQTVNAVPKENLDLLDDDRGVAIHE